MPTSVWVPQVELLRTIDAGKSWQSVEDRPTAIITTSGSTRLIRAGSWTGTMGAFPCR